MCVECPERPNQLANESDWMSDYADSNLKRRSSISKDYLPAGGAAATTTADWLKKSIRRSWTISNAEDDNGSTRDPDVQPYPNPHLPRKQSQSSYPSLVKHPYFNPLSMADEDEYGEQQEEEEEMAGGAHRPAALRRAMPPRQSTLPNPEGIYYGSNNNLMPPVSVSPKQQLSPSPQYNTSPYQTDNEADNETGSDHRSPLAARYKIRRQSTLPCKPHEIHVDGGGGGPLHGGSGPKIMMSSSPNSRTNLYSKSPERDGIETAGTGSKQQQQQRFPPFPLQSQQQQQQQSVAPPVAGQQRQLPTSPNRLVFNKSPDSGTESGPGASESSGTSPHQVSGGRTGAARSYQMTRQATLPNPEQHMKLLPTSPPKKQLSPHSIKRSPDFARQNTLPASQQHAPLTAAGGPQSAPVLLPMALSASSCSSLVGTDGSGGSTGASAAGTLNSLSVHQHGPKFMPVSPRQKASFLFPQPAAPAPRPFHSQQHFPTHLNTSPSASAVSSGAVGATGGIGVSHSSSTSLASAVASKMIKVRSHSNEEYTMAPAATRAVAGLGMGTVSEGRRMLPEIPTGGGGGGTGAGGGGSRSPRLVRQEHVRDELLVIGGVSHSVAGQTGPHTDKRTTTSSSSSPKQKTFAEAKQTMGAAAPMAEDMVMMGYELYGSGHSAGYDECYDEDQEFSLGPIENAGVVGYQDGEEARANEAFALMHNQQRLPFVPNDSSPDSVGETSGYGLANRKDRLRSRRKSRDAYDHQDEPSCGMVDTSDGVVAGPAAVAGEPIKRKPETMRSISEEAPAAKPPKPVTRRSLSHPEKDTQVYNSKKLDSSKIPSPKPLTELQDRQHKPSTAIGTAVSPRRKNIKSFDCGTLTAKAANLQPGGYQQQVQYQQPDGSGSGGPSSVSPGIVTESSCSSNTRTSGYGGSATTLAGNVPGGQTAAGSTMGGFQSFGQRKISAFQQILQRQRLQKRDSKSLDIVASKLMEEKYGSRGQDVDVSKSLDDGIFSESAGHASDDNSSDEHINLTYKPSSKDNKTTLGEAEIQNAVEAAAVIFKKVVLQRREENKCKTSNANHGECHSSADGLTDESGTLGGYSSSETEAAGQGRMQSIGGGQGGARTGVPSDYEEYRLVFFSSDSSSKEEEYDSSSTTSSSAAMRHHARRQRYATATTSLEECDWDYFEPDMMPGGDEAKSAFFYELLAMATSKCEGAPSPHGQCKNTASVGTKASRKPENSASSSSGSSSVPFCHCECCNRRHQMQYVPIPVPVPVPVPIAAFQSWLYEQQQQLLLLHGADTVKTGVGPGGGDSKASADFALRTDLMQQLWKKFAESSGGDVAAEAEAAGSRKVTSNPAKCACRAGSAGGSRRDPAVEAACATSESHDSSDNERNATKVVRTCKQVSARHKSSGASGAESERGLGTGRSSSSGSESAGGGGRVQVQKANPSFTGTRRDEVVGSSSGVSDSRRCSLISSDHDSSPPMCGEAGAAAAAAALQLVQCRVVAASSPPLRAGEFPLVAVPVTTSAANDIATTLAKPIQAQDNIAAAAGEAKTKTVTGRRVQAREITPDSNVRASGATTTASCASPSSVGSSASSGVAGREETGLDTAMDDRQQQEWSLSEEWLAKQEGANVDNKGTDNKAANDNEHNPTIPTNEIETVKATTSREQAEQDGGSDGGKGSKNRPVVVDEQDGYLQYELRYHLAQTGGRSSPSSSSASSSSEAEGGSSTTATKTQRVGKYSFHLTGSSGANSPYSTCSSSSSCASSLREKCSSDDDEVDYFDREDQEDDDDGDDDGCCFDGDDDDEDEDGEGRVAGRSGGIGRGKRFSAVMVINPGRGSSSSSDGEGPTDTDSDDNQSIKAEAARGGYGEVAGLLLPTDGASGDEGDGGGAVVLKRVKRISPDCDEGANECDKLVRKSAEVSIDERESIVGCGRRRSGLDVQSDVEHDHHRLALREGSRTSSPLAMEKKGQCCANAGETNAHNDQRQKVEEKGAPDADCQQKQNPLSCEGSITVGVAKTAAEVEESQEEEAVLYVPSNRDEITLEHTNTAAGQCSSSEVETELQSLPECLPVQRQTKGSGSGSNACGISMQHDHHEESASTVDAVAHDDRKSSTEGYAENPTLIAAGAARTVDDRANSACVEREGERDERDRVSSADGENCVSLDSMDDAKGQPLYSDEMERYDDGEDDGGGDSIQTTNGGNVTGATTGLAGGGTLSAVICLEDGLADDDSWVEEISQDEEEFATTTATDSDLDDSSEEMSFGNDREEELRGYNRTAIDFTLHTIVEESCEESEFECRGSEGRRRGHGFKAGCHEDDDEDDEDDDGEGGGRSNHRDPAHRLSASELEKYFFYGLGGDPVGGKGSAGRATDGADGMSGPGGYGGAHDEQSELSEESSSLCSDGHDSLGSGTTASGSASAARLSGASLESHERDDREDNSVDSVSDLASSRLEKYFLTGFLGYNSSTDRGNGGGVGTGGGGNGSDGSGGSVGSDSEGHASPEQRRKRLVRARGATRSHSSLDNLLLAGGKDAEHGHESIGSNVSQSIGGASYDTGSGAATGGDMMDNSSETDTCDESAATSALYAHQDQSEPSRHDTLGKRKKKFMTKKLDVRVEQQQHGGETAGPSGGFGSESEDSRKTPLPPIALDVGVGSVRETTSGSIGSSLHPIAGIEHSRKQTSRDSGFIGSNDDLLKEDQTAASSKVISSATVEPIQEESKSDIKEGEVASTQTQRTPEYNPALPPVSPGSSGGMPKSGSTGLVSLVRKDSFNNWSSDEETNLMMSKMRQFFKSLVAASANTRQRPASSNSTPGVSGSNTPQQGGSTPVARPRAGMRTTKPPQLVYFESELTRLMKTVPGIRDEQVREIVEYLSSEDTWSDSYDSSDYTSSDLEGTAAAAAAAAVVGGNPFGLQEEISASCRQIISKFDSSSSSSVRQDEEGDIGDGGLVTGGVALAEKEESPLVAHHRHSHHRHYQNLPQHQTPLSKETAFVYQRLVASLSKVVTNEPSNEEPMDSNATASANAPTSVANSGSSASSPPLIAKVMHHIGSRLVALMHEVSSGESHASVSPKQHRMSSHRKAGANPLVGTSGPGGIGGTGSGVSSGHHHHHHLHHHHHHQIISATTTEDDEDSSTCEGGGNTDRQHHYHHHRARVGVVGSMLSTGATAGQDDEDELVTKGGEGSAGVSSSSYTMMLPRSKSHDLLLSDQRTQGPYQYHSGTGSDMVGEERGEASDYERFSWRGSFESALLANGDSRTKLSMLDNSSSSKSILVAKRRSAGDLLFNNQNLSQEQLDRVRSCGSIGGDREELWEAKQQQHQQPYHHAQQHAQPYLQGQHLQQQPHHSHYPPSSTSGSRRRLSSVAADEEDTDSDEGAAMKGNRLVLASRSTLPRSLQNTTMTSGTTNSLPRLPTSNLQTIMQSVASSSSAVSSSSIGTSKPLSASGGNTGSAGGMGQKSQSVYHFLQNNVKSARYRAPGFNRPTSAPKRAMSAPGLQPPYPRRERRNRLQQLSNEESHSPDLTGSTGALGTEDDPHGSGGSRAGPAGDGYDRQGDGTTSSNGMQHKSGGSMVSSPVGSGGGASDNWPSQSDEDIDRLVALHQNRASLSSLGVRSDSMASVYSGAGEGRYGTVTVRGQIEFGMQYNYKQGALEIHVKQCKDLAAVDTKRNRSDPYVKVYLLPDKSKSGKRKTKVKKHTLNPVFDEVLRFHMSLNSLQTRTIWITVWHSDMFGRNDFLGEVMMGLQDKVFDNPQAQWYQLQERSEPFEDLSAYKGDIIVGLKYVSADADSGGIIGAGSGVISGSGGSTSSGFGTLNLRKFSTRSLTSNSSSTLSGHSKGALHVLVKEAKHLQPIKSNGTCDAFCKSYLLPDKNRSSKQKTPVIKRTNSPVWNYTFVYEDVSLAELSERALELTIWDHDRLASNEFLGGVRFSLGNGKHNGRAVEWMDSTGKELSLWQNMINRPNFWVEGALVLRPSLENAKFST
uniref:C2 domain-containing protein n=1 Tax=Anopheles epiroticus TaxID=199890 RepID=A0A182PQ69_9DIPT